MRKRLAILTSLGTFGALVWILSLYAGSVGAGQDAQRLLARPVQPRPIDLPVQPSPKGQAPVPFARLPVGQPQRIDFRMEGQETLLDRTIVERLGDPMIHLIRNAVDHGLETPEERLAKGKPSTGRITIGAGHEGDRVAIRVEDDGRGLDRERIVRKGIALGMVASGTAADFSRRDRRSATTRALRATRRAVR